MITITLHLVATVITETLKAAQDSLVPKYDYLLVPCSATYNSYLKVNFYHLFRDLQVIPALKDLLENQVLKDQMVMMEDLVMMVHKENRDLQAILEDVSIHQAHLLGLEKKEIEDNQENLVYLVKMVFLEHKDLKENAADIHHLECQAILVNQEYLVKMVNQVNQVYLV